MISNIDQRILYWDNSLASFTDVTKELNVNDSMASAISFDADDKLYIGTYFPINHKFLMVSSANVASANVNVEYYGSNQWVSAVDILDYTASSGSPLAQSGNLQFTKDREEGWNIVGDTSDEPFLTEFASGPVIYDKFWSRISFDAPIAATISYVGSLLCSEEDLTREYPHLNQAVLKTSWEAGKTDWLDQRILASEHVIANLVRKSVIIERSQILDIANLKEACVHKTAQIIMNGLGAKNYEKEIDSAVKLYQKAIEIKKYDVDANADGQKQRFEKRLSISRATR